MSLPTLMQTFDLQVQIFQNLFPNFGEHKSRCAAAQPWKTQLSSMEDSGNQSSGQRTTATALTAASEPDQDSVEPARASSNAGDGSGHLLTVRRVPSEVKNRNDLFIGSIDSSIRCDVPLEKVKSLIDSRQPSTSTSTLSASTPLSLAATAPTLAPNDHSGTSSRTSVPTMDADWASQRRDEAGGAFVTDTSAHFDPTSLIPHPSLHQQASWSGETRRSASEENETYTPEETMALPQGRAHSNSAYSYFSSLPTTPIEQVPGHSVTHPHHRASHPSADGTTYRSGPSMLSTSSSTDSESRKRTRAEQNRDKMKAYHRRVMQQREALTSVLLDMSAHVGSLPLSPTRARSGALSGSMLGEGASMGNVEGTSSAGIESSIGRSTQESSWSVSLRKKQKQESKARLRKREIDQVYELGLYANFARANLMHAAGTRSNDGSSRSGLTQNATEADMHVSHAILRVFLRQRPSWIALISAEQRLAGEVAKVSLPMEDEQTWSSETGGSAGKRIKAPIDHIQMEERAGRLAISVSEPLAVLRGSHEAPSPMSFGGSRAVLGGVGPGGQRLSVSQQYLGAGGYHQAGMTEAGMALSPGTFQYGGTLPPSSSTRASGEEGGDYFGAAGRRLVGRYSGGSDPGPSVLSAQIASGFSPGHASGQMPRSMSLAGAQRSGGSFSGMLPSVMASSAQSGGFGYQGVYGGEGFQQRLDAEEMQRQAQAGMGGMQQGPSGPSMQSVHLRVSTPYDARGYARSMMQSAPTHSQRFEQASALLHAQSMQAHSY